MTVGASPGAPGGTAVVTSQPAIVRPAPLALFIFHMDDDSRPPPATHTATASLDAPHRPFSGRRPRQCSN
ncbi:hypothetical protein LUTEI9C_60139 [Luteimonas sp. 9C]|nr:hypothetical protein LUTEI9C_60139 [Luteimonas sp. 9C]